MQFYYKCGEIKHLHYKRSIVVLIQSFFNYSYFTIFAYNQAFPPFSYKNARKFYKDNTMKRTLFLLALTANSAFAQKSDSAVTAGIATNILQKSRAYENLRFLCKQIGPRLSGSDNAQKAVDATARMLREAGADTVYLQPCMVPHWVRGAKEQGEVYINGIKGKDLNVCALGMSIGTPAAGIRAEVIEVKNFDQLKALGAEKVKGKIVFFNYPARPELVFSGYGDAVQYRANGPIEAAKLGAVGVIVRSVTYAMDNNPHTGATRYDAAVTKIPAMAISTMDAEYLSKLLSRRMLGRAGGAGASPFNRNRASRARMDRRKLSPDSAATTAGVAGAKTKDDGKLKVEKAGAENTISPNGSIDINKKQVEDGGGNIAAANPVDAAIAPASGSKTGIEFFMKMSCEQLPDIQSFNVVGELRGTEKPNEVITAGGHLDSWDLAEGAHDDGAGVVQAIEMIRAIKASGQKPKRTIRAVLFMNEENGTRGGNKYAELAELNKDKSLFAVESDAGGFGCTTLGLDGTPAQKAKVRTWLSLFKPYGILDMPDGGHGTDVEPLKKLGTFLCSVDPNSQRYMDVHHAPNDVFEAVNKRELELGAIGMTLISWLVSEYGL
jgi:hypothetical protein